MMSITTVLIIGIINMGLNLWMLFFKNGCQHRDTPMRFNKKPDSIPNMIAKALVKLRQSHSNFKWL